MTSRRQTNRRYYPNTAAAALAEFFPSATPRQIDALLEALRGPRGHGGTPGPQGTPAANGAGATNIGCRTYKTATQSIPDSTPTKVNFDAETYDTDNMHDNITNNTRITINTAGIYLIEANIRFAYNNTGKREFNILLNNATEIAAIQQGAITVVNCEQATNVETLYNFAAADYIEITLYQNSGGALNIDAQNPTFPHFAAQKLANP